MTKLSSDLEVERALDVYGPFRARGGIFIPNSSITNAMLADGAVTNTKLASDATRTNFLPNGGFESWTLGAGPFTTVSTVGPDHWVLNQQAGTLSVSRDSANADSGSRYCAACVVGGAVTPALPALLYATTASSAIAAGYRGRTVTFSARVKTSTPNAVCVQANDGVVGVVSSAFHPGDGTYRTLSLTYPVALSAAFLNCQLRAEAACTFYADNCTLVQGTVASDFQPLVVGTAELADGAVTSAKIADGTITTADIAVGAVQATSSYYTASSFSTTATATWVATPISLSYSATGALARIEVMTTLAHSAVGGFIMFGLMLDSVVQVAMGAYHTPVANYQSPAFGVWYAAPTAGTHTWTLAIYNAVAGTAALGTSTTHGIFVTEQRR